MTYLEVSIIFWPSVSSAKIDFFIKQNRYTELSLSNSVTESISEVANSVRFSGHIGNKFGLRRPV